ncbi:MAG TPA: hypothetical protein DCF95_11490 [Gammaproteobacteria bacterium]|nr:hypothetical protein [Gammaproteobacteria bacterium]
MASVIYDEQKGYGFEQLTTQKTVVRCGQQSHLGGFFFSYCNTPPTLGMFWLAKPIAFEAPFKEKSIFLSIELPFSRVAMIIRLKTSPSKPVLPLIAISGRFRDRSNDTCEDFPFPSVRQEAGIWWIW